MLKLVTRRFLLPWTWFLSTESKTTISLFTKNFPALCCHAFDQLPLCSSLTGEIEVRLHFFKCLLGNHARFAVKMVSFGPIHDRLDCVFELRGKGYFGGFSLFPVDFEIDVQFLHPSAYLQVDVCCSTNH